MAEFVTREDVETYLRARSVEDPITGCWCWSRGLNGQGNPSASIGGKRSIMVRRWAWQKVNGPAGKRRVVSTCGRTICVNLEHLAALTPTQVNRMMAKQGRFSTPAFRNARREAARKKSKLTVESVAKIRTRRAEGATLKVIAKEFGVHWSRVSKICKGEAWADLMPGASVFSWAGAS